MRFTMKRRLTGGQAADPDPRTDPGDVPDDATFVMKLSLRNSDTIPRRMILTLEGTALQTAIVEIWTLDDMGEDRQAGMPDPLTLTQRAARQFYNCTALGALTVTVGELLEFPTVMPSPGTVYVRVTTVPAADSVLKVEPAN